MIILDDLEVGNYALICDLLIAPRQQSLPLDASSSLWLIEVGVVSSTSCTLT
jgi:hypothetical protein